jgi:SAM-dependent methyltransferase
MVFMVAVMSLGMSLRLATPPLPTGGTIALELAPMEVAGSGCTVWPAAHTLCRWQSSVADEIIGTRVLELGAGTGACGLYAAALGARHVVLTDGGPPGVRELMLRNIALNNDLVSGSTVTVERLVWGDGEPPLAGEFDWVFGSDLTYHATEPLAFTLRELLRTASPPRVVLSAQHRLDQQTGADLVDGFLDVARSFGLRPVTISQHREESGHGDASSVRTSLIELSMDGGAHQGAAQAAVDAAVAAGKTRADPRSML